MKTSQAGLEFITKWEGCILKPYKDVAGLRTIGVGHLIQPHENFPDGAAITREEAMRLLTKDVEKCELAICSKISVALTQNQFDALVSFGFNCGTGVYSSSSACKALNQGKYEEFPEKLLVWSKAKVNGQLTTVPGLYSRRVAEGQLFSSKTSQVSSEETVLWTSELLKEVQTILKKLNLYRSSIDGIWGPGTNGGLLSFAKSVGQNVADTSRGIPSKLLSELRKKA